MSKTRSPRTKAIAPANSRWLVDGISDVPHFGSVTEAHLLWKTLTAEREYRSLLTPATDDKALNGYNRVIDGIAEAMITIEAVNGMEIARKITVATVVIEEGGAPNHLEIALMQSAKKDAMLLDCRDPRAAAT
jgi:hypothetical protein